MIRVSKVGKHEIQDKLHLALVQLISFFNAVKYGKGSSYSKDCNILHAQENNIVCL